MRSKRQVNRSWTEIIGLAVKCGASFQNGVDALRVLILFSEKKSKIHVLRCEIMFKPIEAIEKYSSSKFVSLKQEYRKPG